MVKKRVSDSSESAARTPINSSEPGRQEEPSTGLGDTLYRATAGPTFLSAFVIAVAVIFLVALLARNTNTATRQGRRCEGSPPTRGNWGIETQWRAGLETCHARAV